MDVDAVQQLQSGDEPDREDNEEGGVMADGSQSDGGMQDDSDDGGMLDEDQDQDDEMDDSEGDDGSDSDSDGHDDGYEENGNPVVPITSVDVPDGCLGVNDIEARFPLGTNEATKELALGIIGRTIIDPRQVTTLIRQHQGAEPDIAPKLRQKGSNCRGDRPCSLVHLAIDNKSDYTVETIHAEADEGAIRPVALPKWPSDELEEGILTALIDGGADLNTDLDRPLRGAIQRGRKTVFDLLMERDDIDLRGATAMELPDPRRQPPS
ncbi:unnamed protein product [Vitrella brassicaformis CCMP3155]|uniref:Uncharacterized protein n=2 Tax=Vitrella brassicaformis TaxID=1169539 RepID=A0A0G4ECG7_VITBC|nr:unnamed protein product [Vitrella brassicaformis CCMP3155]|eukprot:CEL93419.1 unnamed protein product [Vitrella brassicaformis CCMP3155]